MCTYNAEQHKNSETKENQYDDYSRLMHTYCGFFEYLVFENSRFVYFFIIVILYFYIHICSITARNV